MTQLAFENADQVISFAQSLAPLEYATRLSPLPNHLTFPRKIWTQYSPITHAALATVIWCILQGHRHLVALDLEDGDRILESVWTSDIFDAPLSLPLLQDVSYRMLSSVQLCDKFLSALRSAPLQTLALIYPDYIGAESRLLTLAHLLSKDCVASLTSLTVKGLKYEYLETSPSPNLRRHPHVSRLTLEFTIDDPSHRKEWLVEFILTFFPNVSELNIAVIAPPLHTNSWVEPIRGRNAAAWQRLANAPRLAKLSASLLDMLLLDFPCCPENMTITSIDLYTVTHLLGQKLVFKGRQPRVLEVRFREARPHAPLEGLNLFLGLLRGYWDKFKYTGVPEDLILNVRVHSVDDSMFKVTLERSLNLARNSDNLKSLCMLFHLECERDRPHRPGIGCTEAHDFVNRTAQSLGEARRSPYADLLSDARLSGLWVHIRASSFCMRPARILHDNGNGRGAMANFQMTG